jgi:rhamnosyltransferase
MRRLLIAYYYDKFGVFDEYMATLLAALSDHVEQIVLVIDGKLNPESKERARSLVDKVVFSPKAGLFAGYRAGIAALGDDAIAACDELVFCDNSIFGPLFPVSELFKKMSGEACDFWGVTAAKVLAPAKSQSPEIPYYPDSSFLVFRREILKIPNFVGFWRRSHDNASPDQVSVAVAEYFCSIGFAPSCYLNPARNASDHPIYFDIDDLIRDRAPFLKCSVFYRDPATLERYAVDLPSALETLRETSDYDVDLIWRHVIRVARLRDLNTNAALVSVLADTPETSAETQKLQSRIAMCMHVYYVEMLEDLLKLCDYVPMKYDFIATTDSIEKKRVIEETAARHPKIDNTIVRIVEQNRGRDMGSLFITCRDLFLDDHYELVCRLHTKRTPQVETSRSNIFRRHLFENLLHSQGYVSNVIDLFMANPRIGVAIPPVLHVSFWTLGHAWYANREPAERVARELGFELDFDDDTPVAPYGTMYWFRPPALRRLFAHEWRWEDYNREPHHSDGGLAHVQERLISYAAQAEGYLTQHIMCAKQAAYSYVWLEYKLQKLLSLLPNGHFDYHVNLLAQKDMKG